MRLSFSVVLFINISICCGAVTNVSGENIYMKMETRLPEKPARAIRKVARRM